MYAVVEIGGHQYRVAEGDVLYVDRQSEESGDSVTFNKVLMLNDDNGVNLGGPAIDGASVEATLVDHVKADKVIVFKKKRRKGYRKKNGHRQPMSQIRIESIAGASSSSSSKSTKKEEPKETKSADTEAKVSTDMTAKDAIDHIENTPLNQLEGFVPESEDRVTVQRAWDDKQES